MPEEDTLSIEGRVEETVGGDLDKKGVVHTDFDPHPDSVKHPRNKKKESQARMVVEIFFDVPKDRLRTFSDHLDKNLLHPIDYLRWRKEQFDQGDIDLGDLSCDEFATGKIRLEVSK